MSMFNEKQIEGLLTGNYYCKECGTLMVFEDEWRETLVCPECSYETDLDRYGFEDEEYDLLYPLKEEYFDEDDDEH